MLLLISDTLADFLLPGIWKLQPMLVAHSFLQELAFLNTILWLPRLIMPSSKLPSAFRAWVLAGGYSSIFYFLKGPGQAFTESQSISLKAVSILLQVSSHTHLVAILFSASLLFGLLSPGFWLFLYLASNFSLRLEVCCLEPKEAVCCPRQPQKVGLCTPLLVTNSSLDRKWLISRPHPVAVQMGMGLLIACDIPFSAPLHEEIRRSWDNPPTFLSWWRY